MPRFQTSRHVNHSSHDMFDLVADIERYPEFVPLCKALDIISRDKQDHDESIVAKMVVSYKFFSESFKSRVLLQPSQNVIIVTYIDGPFRHMENRWSFISTSAQSCTVNFFLDYDFRSRTLGILMGSVFDRAFRQFSQAFEMRADKVYGKNSLVRHPPTLNAAQA